MESTLPPPPPSVDRDRLADEVLSAFLAEELQSDDDVCVHDREVAS